MKCLQVKLLSINSISMLLLFCLTLTTELVYSQADKDYSFSFDTYDKNESIQIGNTFIGYLTQRNFDGLASLFSDSISFRALLPPALATSDNPDESANHFKTWFHLDEGDEYKVIDSNAELIVDCLHIYYVIDVTKSKQVYRAEQQIFCEISNDKIQKLSLLCSGPRKITQ